MGNARTCLTAVQVSDDNTVDSADLSVLPGLLRPAVSCSRSFRPPRAAIEAELLRQPGYRHNAPFRNWEPGWSLDVSAGADGGGAGQDCRRGGDVHPGGQSIGTPRTWAVGEVLTAANMNTFVREIQKDLSGANGPVELLHGMRPGSFTTAELAALSGVPEGTMFYDSDDEVVKLQKASALEPVGFDYHRSDLFAFNEVVTVNHDLGKPPRLFQLWIERVAAADDNGYSTGDGFYALDFATGATNAVPHIYDATSNLYEFLAFGSIRARNRSGGLSATMSLTIDNDATATLGGRGYGARVYAFA